MATTTCAHASCTCGVAEDVPFCSDFCRSHGGDAQGHEHSCECGHPGCGGA